MIIDSQPIKKEEALKNPNIVSLTFELDGASGGVNVIEDERITSETLAYLIAEAELLENGYVAQTVEFTTSFADVAVGDIIVISAPTFRIPKELNKDRFIVKRVEHIIQNGAIKTKITAVRYDL